LRRIYTSTFLFDDSEVDHVLQVIKSGWITQGREVAAFEKEYAEYVGCKHAIAVNSGSSANLVAMTVFTHKSLGHMRIRRGDEVITSPVTFPTSCFPIIQVGAIPVFVDVDPETLCIDENLIQEAINPKTKAIVPIHLLGHPANMKFIMDIAEDHHLLLLEDACESHGAECYGRKVGSFGEFGSFSFFAAHHICTGEGGMLVTNDDKLADLARSIRGFGRVVVASDVGDRAKEVNRYKIYSEKLGPFDVRQTFTDIGYSLKMTDLQAAIGREQLKKLDVFVDKRRENAHYIIRGLKPFKGLIQLPVERKWAKHSYHHLPIILKPSAHLTRLEVITFLEERGIETRPIEAGNLVDQPCMEGIEYKVFGSLTNSENIKDNGFFIGTHPGLTKEDLDYVIHTFLELFSME
jgi:CDP-6-deoxy-D-xylo-4-hexulose-3-dehydrase